MLDKNKNTVFEKDYTPEIFPTNILENETGELIITGQYGTVGEGKFFLKKYSSDLNQVWSKDFGQKKSLLNDAIITTDGGYALVGYTKEYNANYTDVIFIKTDKDGNTDLIPKKYTKVSP